ncbi:MAG: hypothetical protein AAF604_09980 [Acidobacteriota bacterium]
MKLPAYPLEALRRHREGRRDEARRALAAQVAAVAAASGRLQAAEELAERRRSSLGLAERDLFGSSPRRPRHAFWLAASSSGLACLRRQVDEAWSAAEGRRRELADEEQQLAQCQRRLAARAREVRAVEKHFEIWRRRRLRSFAGRENKAVADFVTSGWVLHTGESR